MPVKTVLAIHDMVSLGRCSLTVVIPALSAMGIKVSPLPTAVLSSDTGGFGPVFMQELSGAMDGILTRLEGLQPRFDAVYSGYLGSPGQAKTVLRAMESFDGFHVVDPVMGDEGKLYSAITKDMVDAMRKLCTGADLITPNLTEAMFLLDQAMPKEALTGGDAAYLLERLSRLGSKACVVTGVPLKGFEQGLATLLIDGRHMAALAGPKLDAHFPGTGDLFASVLIGCLLGEKSLFDAVLHASGFVCHAMAYTLAQGSPVREGVLIEALLPDLITGNYDLSPYHWLELN